MLHIYFALVLSVPVVGVAQESQATVNTPQLVTSASAEVELKPDRASISFTVESRGPTAARAGAESARRQRAVLDTLRALGVAADQVQTAAIQINPEYANSGPNSAARVTGYAARNTIRIEVVKIEVLGALIDAGLSAGASGIGSLRFRSSREDDARRQALALAVGMAKAEAEAMARAAGGGIAGLIELRAEPSFQRTPMDAQFESAMQRQVAGGAETPVVGGIIRVSATVTARWAYTAR